MSGTLIQTPGGVATVLVGIAAFFFFLEKQTGWKVFRLFPPLLWIYAIPLVLTNTGVLPSKSPTYDVIRQFGLPVFIVLLLLGINVNAAFRIMGRGVLVMLLGTVGVVIGGPVAYFVVHRWLPPDAWKGFGALAGSWVGGTGNMAAVGEGLGTPGDIFGLAVLADNVVYVIWMPILLGSKAFAEKFNRWTGVDEGHMARMEAAIDEHISESEQKLAMRHLLYLGFIGFSVAAFADWISPRIPEIEPILSTSTWEVLIVTTIGILLSLTPAREIPSSHDVAMAIVYVFVARMGASSSLSGLADAPAFLLGALIWITIHGAFCLAGAWLFKVDVHSAAIASAANIGGAASAPVVAAYHRESLVPVSILMALIGYAIGNYAGFLTGWLCHIVGG